MLPTALPFAPEESGRFDLPVYLYREGTNRRAYRFLGAHPRDEGWEFLCYAPDAEELRLVGDFNGWTPQGVPMTRLYGDFWYVFMEGFRPFDQYKFVCTARNGSTTYLKDPYAFHTENGFGEACKLYDPAFFPWEDENWLLYRKKTDFTRMPLHIYEMHLGSWKRDDRGNVCSYESLAREALPYIRSMGYTHLSLFSLVRPGDFHPSPAGGAPGDMMRFINECHKAGLGVLLDLGVLPAFHEKEKRSDALSQAVFFLDVYHFDGLSYAASGDDLAFFNKSVREECPDALLLASGDALPRGVTADTDHGGLGFDFKWNRAWADETLAYFSLDPASRKKEYDKITFPMSYAFTERHILPFSHDETALIGHMAGDYPEKFANLRLLFAAMISFPGKKLTFMGDEFAQFAPWDPDKGLDFFLLDFASHRDFHTYMRDLNFFYLEHEALWQNDYNWEGFQWIVPDDSKNGVLAFRRIADTQKEIIAVFHLAPGDIKGYSLGVPYAGRYTVIFSTDELRFGGNGQEYAPIEAEKDPLHALPYRLKLDLAPFSASFLEVKRIPEEI